MAKRGKVDSATKKGKDELAPRKISGTKQEINWWEPGKNRGKAEVATKKRLSQQVRKGESAILEGLGLQLR